MSNREIPRMVCAAVLAAAIGCNGSPPSPPLSQNGEPGSQTGALPVQTKDLPKGAKLGTAKAFIQ